jgi:hypothetical protein
MRRYSLLLVGLTLMLTASSALAEVPPLLQQGTRPMWATLGLGGAFNLRGGGGHAFKLIETFGYHFSGNGTGPAIGGDLQEAFGEGGFYNITIGPKFVWDFAIVQNLALFLSPSALLGYSYAGVGEVCNFGQCVGGGGSHAFAMQFAFDAKLILGNRWLVFFRPFGLGFDINGDGTGIHWDMMFGGGATF